GWPNPVAIRPIAGGAAAQPGGGCGGPAACRLHPRLPGRGERRAPCPYAGAAALCDARGDADRDRYGRLRAAAGPGALDAGARPACDGDAGAGRHAGALPPRRCRRRGARRSHRARRLAPAAGAGARRLRRAAGMGRGRARRASGGADPRRDRPRAAPAARPAGAARCPAAAAGGGPAGGPGAAARPRGLGAALRGKPANADAAVTRGDGDELRPLAADAAAGRGGGAACRGCAAGAGGGAGRLCQRAGLRGCLPRGLRGHAGRWSAHERNGLIV
ncbi:MAG: Transcriptional regulator, AraC family, partial [uncultured Craurococcus sp.]